MSCVSIFFNENYRNMQKLNYTNIIQTLYKHFLLFLTQSNSLVKIFYELTIFQLSENVAMPGVELKTFGLNSQYFA